MHPCGEYEKYTQAVEESEAVAGNEPIPSASPRVSVCCCCWTGENKHQPPTSLIHRAHIISQTRNGYIKEGEYKKV